MVVILLLTPYTSNGCDGGSNESTASTTSTGVTAIPTAAYKAYQRQQQQQQQQQQHQQKQQQSQPHQAASSTSSHQHHQQQQQNKFKSQRYHAAAHPSHHQHHVQPSTEDIPSSVRQHAHYSQYTRSPKEVRQAQHFEGGRLQLNDYSFARSSANGEISQASSSLSPKRLPKNLPSLYQYSDAAASLGTEHEQSQLHANAVPKPPRRKQHGDQRHKQRPTSIGSSNQAVVVVSQPKLPSAQKTAATTMSTTKSTSTTRPRRLPEKQKAPPPPKRPSRAHPSPMQLSLPNSHSFTNTTADIVRHVTRVNFYDYESSQVESGTNDDGDDVACDTEATTKDEEWITKRKTELTTTRQIETRVKRQVVLEDGKVIEDSGPIVSTNTTEDTDKKETETTERRDLGCPESIDDTDAAVGALDINDKKPTTATNAGLAVDAPSGLLAEFGGKVVQKLVPRPADGLVRETNEKRVISREEIKDRLETEDVRHLGDFSDETYLKAVNSGAENLETILYSPQSQQELVPLGPRIIHQSNKAHKTIDTEDTVQRCLAQDDGTLVTEKKKTTEHEEIFDEDLPEKDDHSRGSQEKINTTESTQRYYKQRDEQNVDIIAGGKVIATEMRYAAETEQMERDGPAERPGDWDSLSDRIRKARRAPKTLLQQQKEAAMQADRKDALTKRPLDFDREEETRKGETMKWLVSHFGSESTASNDSREDDTEIEPTKKTFFNVTIKSNQTTPPGVPAGGKGPAESRQMSNGNGLIAPSKIIAPEASTLNKTKYFQGISNWADRKDVGPKHFASKAFREELQGTLERNRANRHTASREELRYAERSVKPNDTYVSREDILQQKRQHNVSGTRSDLRFRRDSRDELDELKTIRAQKEDLGYLSGSRTDVRYRLDSNDEHNNIKNRRSSGNGFLKREDSGYVKDSSEDVRSSLHRDGDVGDEKPPVQAADKYNKGLIIQRDDSAYVSSSTYFTETRPLPKTVHAAAHHPLLRTPDSGIRSPSSIEPSQTDFNSLNQSQTPLPPDAGHRPTVPQRRRAIEKKLRQQTSYSPPSPVPFHHEERDEPPPDYSPPPRSRSVSPLPIIIPPHPTTYVGPHASGVNAGANVGAGAGIMSRKQNQRTRFASESSSASQPQHHHQSRPAMSTQTTQTSPPSVSGSASTVATHHHPLSQHNTQKPPASSKVGQAIGNSLRKLVGKIRTASAERKFRMKSKSKSSERSPSPPAVMIGRSNGSGGGGGGGPGSTYQQYNVIDSHIGGQTAGSSGNSSLHHHHQQQQQQQHHHSKLQQRNSVPINRETSSVVSSLSTTIGRDRASHHNHHNNHNGIVHTTSTTSAERSTSEQRRGSSDLDYMASPKRYYLGEDPYSGSLFGKGNKYDPMAMARRNREARDAMDSSEPNRDGGGGNLGQYHNQQQLHRSRRGTSYDDHREKTFVQQRNMASNTLGRYQKSNHRLVGSTPNLDHDYRSAQTLPRKLADHHHQKQQQQEKYQRPHHHSSTINVSIVNPVKQQQQQSIPRQNTGPAKPARTYAKSLNRSRSCNVHGMNGTNDPSPIYIEKLTRNNYASTITNSSYLNGNSNVHKSNPHLYSSGGGGGGEKENYPLQSGLKSPSIVNLISRSQKDLTKIDAVDAAATATTSKYPSNYMSTDRRYSSNHQSYSNGIVQSQQQEKKQAFLKGLQDEAPDLYKTLHGGGDSIGSNGHRYPSMIVNKDHELASSLGSRSPIEINKDTASIIRRSSSSTEDYSESYKYTTKSDDHHRPMVTNTVQNFSKKTIPTKDGRGFETIHSSEKRSVSKQVSSQYRGGNGISGDPMSNLKYIEEQKRRGSGSTIIEVRNSKRN